MLEHHSDLYKLDFFPPPTSHSLVPAAAAGAGHSSSFTIRTAGGDGGTELGAGGDRKGTVIRQPCLALIVPSPFPICHCRNNKKAKPAVTIQPLPKNTHH